MKQIHYYILFLFTRKSDGPLDHINKQTQRIRITSLSPVQKAECSKQIQESCRQLTSLLDEMLEKAYHESTTESQETPPD